MSAPSYSGRLLLCMPRPDHVLLLSSADASCSLLRFTYKQESGAPVVDAALGCKFAEMDGGELEG